MSNKAQDRVEPRRRHRRSLASAILLPSLLGTVVTLGLAGFAAYALLSLGLSTAFDERLRTAQLLFTKNITQDVNTGINSEVYRKCKSFLDDPSVIAVRVVSRIGTASIVCDLKKEGSLDYLRVIETSIFFDEAKKNVAANIQISYTGADLQRLLRQSMGLLILVVLLVAVIQFLIARVLSSIISRPIAVLAGVLRGGEILALTKVQLNAKYNGRISEITDLLEGTEELGKTLGKYQEQLVITTRQAAVAQFASQIVHDLRSPLASLQAVIHNAQGLDEESRVLVRASANRIRDIANNLLSKNREIDGKIQRESSLDTQNAMAGSGEPKVVEMLAPLIESLISEKRAQYGAGHKVKISCDIPPAQEAIFANFQPLEFSRALSNLINNAIESIESNGFVNISLSSTGQYAFVSIKDTGKGIPPELLSKVVERGGTYGKQDGNGLGLSHAIASAKSWGGDLNITSDVGVGTVVTLSIPLAPAPQWFASEIKLRPDFSVITVDDDPSIEQVWRKRFGELKLPSLHLHSPKELLAWYRENPSAENILCLCDYEFTGNKQTGLELIETLGMTQKSILVTSRWDDETIRSRCEKIGLKILPKSMAGTVPIQLA